MALIQSWEKHWGVWFMSLGLCPLDGLFTHVILVDMVCISMVVLLSGVLSGVFCSSRKLRTDGGVAIIAFGGVVNCSVWIALR